MRLRGVGKKKLMRAPREGGDAETYKTDTDSGLIVINVISAKSTVRLWLVLVPTVRSSATNNIRPLFFAIWPI